MQRPWRTPAADRDIVAAVVRGFGILGAFTPQDTWLGNAELAARTGLPKATVSRFARTLTLLGYLHFSARRRQYRLAPPVLSLGYATAADFDIRHIARPLMQRLANRLDVLVALGTRDALDIVHVESCNSAHSIVSLRLEPGTRGRIAETAFGRALLAALPLTELDATMAALEARYGPRWPEIHRAVKQAMSDITQRGFCTIVGSWRPDINAVGVPLRLVPGQPILSLGLAGFAGQLTRRRCQQHIGPELVALAREIESRAA